MNANFKVWAKSGLAAFISGGSSAATAWGGFALAKGAGVDVPDLNWKGAVIIFAAAGAHGLLMYLAKSPLPGVNAPAKE